MAGAGAELPGERSRGPAPSRAAGSPNDRALAALRMALGLLFVCFGEYKVFGTGFVPAGFTGWISRFIEGHRWRVPS